MANQISKFVVSGEDQLTPIFDKIGQSVNSLDKRMGKMGGTLIESMLKTHVILKAFDGIQSAFSKTADLFKDGIEVNIETEKTMLGIAATLSSVYEFRDAVEGIKLEGVDKFNASMKVSEGIMRRLTISAITTAASVKDVTEAFSATVAIGAQQGLKPEQVERMSSMVANASKVFGLMEGQASQELRAILTGKIDKTSTIGTALGLGPDGSLSKEFKRALQLGGDELANFMDKTLAEYTRASETMAQRLSGMFDAGKETYKLFAKDITIGMGDELLKLKDTINKLFIVDKNKGIYEWGKELQPVIGLLGTIGEYIGSKIVGAFNVAISLAQEFSKYLQDNPQILNAILQGLDTVITVMGTIIGTAINIGEAIFNVFNTISESVITVFSFIGGLFSTAEEGIDNLDKKGQKSVSGLTKLFHLFLNGLNVGFALIGNTIASIPELLSIAIGKTTVAIYRAIKWVSEQVLTVFTFLIDNVATLISVIDTESGNAIKNALKSINTAFKEDPEFIKNIEQQNSELAGKLETQFKDTSKAIDDLWANMNKLGDAGQKNKITDYTKKLNDLLAKFGGKYDLGSKLKDTQRDNLKGIENEYNAIKKSYDGQLKLLELYNSYGLVELENYYSRKGELQDKSFDEEIKALEKIKAYHQGKAGESVKGKDEKSQDDYIKHLDKVQDTENKIAELKEKNFYDQQERNLKQQKDIQEYLNSMDNVLADLYELKGLTSESYSIKLKIEIEGLREKFRNNPEMSGIIDQIQNEKEVKGLADEIEKQYGLDLKHNTNLLEKYNIQKDSGRVGEIDYLLKVKSVNESNIVLLKNRIELEKSIADGSQQSKDRIAGLSNELLKLESTADPLKTKFDEIFKTGFTENFAAVIEGTKSVADAFKDLAKSIEQEITRLVANQLFTTMTDKMFGGKSSSGGGGGFFDSFGSMASSFIGSIMGKASGGLISGPTLVGETGPELFFPNSKGFIMNTPRTNELLNNSGGGQVNNINININSNTPEAFRNSETQLYNTVQKVISKGNKMN